MAGYTAELQDLEMAMMDWFWFQAGWGFWGNSWVSGGAGEGHNVSDRVTGHDMEPGHLKNH
jgi:hypothetical protein